MQISVIQPLYVDVMELNNSSSVLNVAKVGGTFGVAKVVATGSKVTSLSTGNLVLLSHYKQGSWQRQLLASPKDVVAVPLGLYLFVYVAGLVKSASFHRPSD